MAHSHRKRKIFALVVVLAFLMSTLVLFAAATDSYTVTLAADGETQSVTTRAKAPADILAEANIAGQTGDLIATDAFHPGQDSALTLYRARRVTINESGKKPVIAVIAGTVARALEQGGYTLRAEDIVTPALDTELSEGLVIDITRAFKVTATADGETRSLWLTGGTVESALAALNVEYKKADEVSPALGAKLSKATDITVGRVETKTRVVEEKVPFTSTTRNSNDLYVGEKKVETKGVDGLNKVTYVDRFVDGKQVNTVKEKTVEIKKPVQEVKLVGAMSAAYKPIVLKTGLKPISVLQPSSKLQLDENGIPKNYKSVVEGLAKSYSIGKYGASGGRCVPGTIAVDPKQFPYGTELYIVSTDGKYVYGYAIANDTGGFVKTNSCMVDLYMPSMQACINWGARNVRVYVL
ncbi:MAG: ubiquitin-like domain-containing protein [Oscillospiraceae bacterium]|jgi:uncharacterized protein YabE (DUF348 family)/3D (Asp-Asp-Asp) domain-containing protein|nr:ubiquitin-like domain-containing protein [Oscillospiraceae bacterium]